MFKGSIPLDGSKGSFCPIPLDGCKKEVVVPLLSPDYDREDRSTENRNDKL